MKPIKLDGIDAEITDIFLGIQSLLQEGDKNRYEMSALPQNQLSALGTRMYVNIRFGEMFPVGEGTVLTFGYDKNEKEEKVGVDRTPQKVSESFYIKPPYWSQSIKKMGDHVLTVTVSRKYKFAGVITMTKVVGNTYIPYTVVPPAQE